MKLLGLQGFPRHRPQMKSMPEVMREVLCICMGRTNSGAKRVWALLKVMRAALNCFYLFIFIFCRVKLRLASSQIGPINVSACDGHAAASDLLTRSYL